MKQERSTTKQNREFSKNRTLTFSIELLKDRF